MSRDSFNSSYIALPNFGKHVSGRPDFGNTDSNTKPPTEGVDWTCSVSDSMRITSPGARIWNPDLGSRLDVQCIRQHEDHVCELVQDVVHGFGDVAAAPASKSKKIRIRTCI
jgi:hypothetical protein